MKSADSSTQGFHAYRQERQMVAISSDSDECEVRLTLDKKELSFKLRLIGNPFRLDNLTPGNRHCPKIGYLNPALARLQGLLSFSCDKAGFLLQLLLFLILFLTCAIFFFLPLSISDFQPGSPAIPHHFVRLNPHPRSAGNSN